MWMRYSKTRNTQAPVVVIAIKTAKVLACFTLFDLLPLIPSTLLLFFVTTGCAVLLVGLQRPFSSSKKLNKQLWIKIFFYALLVTIVNLLWINGLGSCGPLRTTILWDYSEIAMTAVFSMILSCGSHSKTRGAVCYVLGLLTLLLFDNDLSTSQSDHPEGTHNSVVVHHLYAILGVSDHKGQMLMLVLAMVLYSLQCHVRKNLAAEVGGAKRLHALTTVVVALLLCPGGMYQWLTTEVELGVGVVCSIFLCSVVLLADFYSEISRSSSQQQSPQQPQYHHVILLGTTFAAFMFAALLWTHPPWVAHNHDVSVGLLMATVLFLIAASMLNYPGRGSGRTLIGYSASGLPLYSGEVSPTNWIKESLHSILINPDSRRIFYFLCLNLMFTFVELLYGAWNNSLGLISDGFHMLFDCTALLVGLHAAIMTKWKPTRIFSYGYGRAEILSGFINALFLIVIAFFVFLEAIGRLLEPPEINTNQLVFVSVAGLMVNLTGVFAFSHHGHHHHHHGHHDHHHHHHDNANMKGVFLHVLADTLGSVGVIISSLLIQYYGWLIADPICSLFIAVLVFMSVIPLLRDSTHALLLATANQDEVSHTLSKLLRLDGVLGYTHAHFWKLSSQALVGSIHLQVAPSVNQQRAATMVIGLLKECGVTQATVQVEKEAFFNSELANMATIDAANLSDSTPPHVYVTNGPTISNVKAI